MNKSDVHSPTSVLILAGGKSSRMNFPKMWLPFDNRQCILEHLIDEYLQFGCEQVIVVLNREFAHVNPELHAKIQLKATVVWNYYPDHGRIYSIQLGIDKLNQIGLTFIHNVDNPYAERSTLDALLRANPLGYAKPTYNNSGGHPILIKNSVLIHLAMSDTKAILRDVLREHDCTQVPVDDAKVLCNINTQEDYRHHFDYKIPSMKISDHGRFR